MAHYSSDSHLWYDETFLGLGRLERVLVLYMMHGPGRSNVPGISEDSPVTIADRLRESVEEIRAALAAMCERPEVLRMDASKRLLSSPLAARMDPHRGSKSIRGWYKNWTHLPEAPLKYEHIAILREKVDFGNEEQVKAWNETFGTEADGTYAVTGREPVQLRLLSGGATARPTRGEGKRVPRHQETAKPAERMPGRDRVDHIAAPEYVESYSANLLEAGIPQEMGADAETFAQAMVDLSKKAPGHKRVAEWDQTALNYIESALYIGSLRGNTKRGHNESNRGGSEGPRRPARARPRGDAADHSTGQWSDELRRKASEPSIFSDP